MTRESITCDVLVLGGGGAALRAALEAARAGARVCQIVRGRRVGIGGATSFGVAETAGYAIPDGGAGTGDSPSAFADEMLNAAMGCADPELVRVVAEDAIAATELLRKHGLDFMRKEDGSELIARGDFATLARNRKILGHGRPISELLAKLAIDDGRVEVSANSIAVDLLRDATGVRGALLLDAASQPVVVHAGATVLATGGAGQLFEHSLMPPDICGGGYALAASAGARLTNMEFVQAGFGILRPALHMVMPWYWRDGVRLVDAEGEPVLPLAGAELDPDAVNASKRLHYPFSTSDLSGQLELAAKQAIAERPLTEHGALRMQLPCDTADGDEHGFWSVTRQWLGRKGVDVDGGALEVGLFGHSVNGGVAIDVNGASTVPGLYAAGEVTGGAYGADRLGGTMLLACQVFGRRAGRAAAAYAQGVDRRADGRLGTEALSRNRALIEPRLDGRPVRQLLTELRRTMSTDVLIARSEVSLKNAAARLNEIDAILAEGGVATPTRADQVAAADLRSLLITGRLMVQAASERRESRGAHYRADHPAPDPAQARPLGLLFDANDRTIRTEGQDTAREN